MEQVLKRAAPLKAQGTSLLKVADSDWFCEEDASVESVAEALKLDPAIQAIGITSNGQYRGILSRSRLFAILGRPFGWDILCKDHIGTYIEECPSFHTSENVFNVAADLKDILEGGETRYYGIVDDEGNYLAAFSSRGLLLFLARLNQKDVELAGLLQERMVQPQFSLDENDFALRAFSRAAKGMGGDFYFQKKIGKKAWFMAIGDVSGKGASASVVTSLLWGMLRMYDYKKGLKRLLIEINEAIITTFHLERHVTGIFMVWDFAEKRVTLADMGHGLCFMLRNGHYRAIELPVLNYPLGIEREMKPKLYKIGIKPGDLFCAYTDGLVEQRNEKGLEFGIETLAELAIVSNDRPDRLHETVKTSLDRYRKGLPQTDDATWIQVAVK